MGKVKKKKEITAGQLFPLEEQREVLLKLHLAWVEDLIELCNKATHRSFPREAVKFLIEIQNLLSGMVIHENYSGFVGLQGSAYQVCNEVFAHFMSDEEQDVIM